MNNKKILKSQGLLPKPGKFSVCYYCRSIKEYSTDLIRKLKECADKNSAIKEAEKYYKDMLSSVGVIVWDDQGIQVFKKHYFYIK